MLIIQNYLQLIPMYILYTQNYASIIYTQKRLHLQVTTET